MSNDKVVTMGSSASVEKLEKVDLLELRLANRDIDVLRVQMELLQTKLQEADGNLTTITEGIMEKYKLNPVDKVDISNGSIMRVPMPVEEDSEEEEKDVEDEG